MILRTIKIFRLGAVAAILLWCTACLEHFESLWTRVIYDPYAQSFQVERRLYGVEPKFLGCSDLEGCLEAIERSLSVSPNPGYSMALSDRLLQRLLESGATNVDVSLERDGDRLDVVLRYRARVGSPAADDTFVRAEWNGQGSRGRYSLVVIAQDAMAPPPRYQTRRVARGGAGEIDWVEEWVLPPSQREVRTQIPIDRTQALFAEIPGLAEALEARGWLGPKTVPPPMDVGTPISRLLDRLLPGSREAPDQAPPPGGGIGAPPIATLQPVALPAGEGPSTPESASTELDPSSPAKTWVYEARVSGGAITPAAAAVALEPLIPAISSCYQRRQREVPDLAGNIFLSALVRSDGSVLATSVSGSLGDAELIRCVERVLGGWRFAGWGTGPEVSDVAVPVVFRVERGSSGRGKP